MRGKSLTLSAMAGSVWLGLLGVACQGQVVNGTVVSHNGSATSTPPGSGAAAINLTYPFASAYPYQGTYQEMATHELEFTYAPGPATDMYNSSLIFNETGIPWFGFQILLSGADFAGWSHSDPTQARTGGPVVDFGYSPSDVVSLALDQVGLQHWVLSTFSLSGSTITHFNDLGSGPRDALLSVVFDEPVLPGKGFALWYSVIPSSGAANATGFSASYTPIPEPTTLAMLAWGMLAVLGHGLGRR
jgi:hypothetical protein